MAKKGNIIILNGVSSSGKTTLARCLQDVLDEEYFWISVDVFFSMAPQKLLVESMWLQTFSHIRKAMYTSITALSDSGVNVIIDDVMLSRFHRLEECVHRLKGYPVLLVRVDCPIEELRRRERERGDRLIGQAESQLPELEPRDTYDVVVDTSEEAAEACAGRIKSALPGKMGKAFSELIDLFCVGGR